MTTDHGRHDLDRLTDEPDEEYGARINAAAAGAGQSRVEYERAANERAGRPPITPPPSDSQEPGGIL